MFGLMRAKKCGMSDAEKNFRRVNYCGTCKTIGSLYGQTSRLLLNNDTVFLAELLTALSGENVEDWHNSYQSYNCLNLPKDKMSLALQFAATTNLILTKFKLADHIADEGKRRYKFANNAFSNDFQKAETLLKDWDFPLEKVWKILQTQVKIETESKNLEDFALPTAETTAEFFAHGTKLIGNENLQVPAYEIGFNFGKLVYLLDAFEDYEKDFRSQNFNAFHAAFDLKEENLSAVVRQKIFVILQDIKNKIIAEIYQLPIAENQKNLFVLRLSDNLQRKLKTNSPVLKAKKVCEVKPKQTFSEKWQNAAETAKNLARNYSWQMPLVFLFIFVFALVAPAQSREAKSARECLDLSFNLMFLGAIFGSVLAIPKTILLGEPNPKEKLSKQIAEDAGDGATDCCCDCGCDGCCDNCDCSGCCDCSCDC